MQLANELVRCQQNPAHFISEHVRIKLPSTDIAVPLCLNKQQTECLSKFHEQQLSLIMKERQKGMSTLCAAYALWTAMFNDNSHVVVIVSNWQFINSFVRIVEFGLEHMHQAVKPYFEISEPSQSQYFRGVQQAALVKFDNSSTIEVIRDVALLHKDCSLVIVDEISYHSDFNYITLKSLALPCKTIILHDRQEHDEMLQTIAARLNGQTK